MHDDEEWPTLSRQLINASRMNLASASRGTPSTSIEAGDQRYQLAVEWMRAAPEMAETARDIIRCACQAWVVSKQIDSTLREALARYEASVTKTVAVAPLVARQLEALSEQCHLLLTEASRIDSSRAAPAELVFRTELVRFARECHQTLQLALIRFLSL